MPTQRNLGRNVAFSDATAPNDPLGGFIQNGSITEANFLNMVGIIVVARDTLRVQERASGRTVESTNTALPNGNYDIYCDDPIQVTDEPWIHRLISHSVSGRIDEAFLTSVRTRDGKCVVTGTPNIAAYKGDWSSFEAAHVFPLEQQSLFLQLTGIDEDISKINSPKNGLLMASHVHQQFDQYLFSINPDDNYKITVFGEDMFRLNGSILDPICRDPNNPHCVSDELLRWHYRQSVLGNVRGAGEPIFEHDDYPSGTDMVAEISEGPYARER